MLLVKIIRLSGGAHSVRFLCGDATPSVNSLPYEAVPHNWLRCRRFRSGLRAICAPRLGAQEGDDIRTNLTSQCMQLNRTRFNVCSC